MFRIIPVFQNKLIIYVSVFLPVGKIFLSKIKYFQNCLTVNEVFAHQAKGPSFWKENVKEIKLTALKWIESPSAQ